MASTFRRKKNKPSNIVRIPSSSTTTNNDKRSNEQQQQHGSSTIGYLQGCKPFAGNITRTSYGLRDMDSIIGGGQPLGTIILLEHADTPWTLQTITNCLLKYWCSEAISQNQCLWIPTTSTTIGQGGKDDSPDDDSLSSSSKDESCFQLLSQKDAIEKILCTLPRNLNWDKNFKRQEAQTTTTSDKDPSTASPSSSSSSSKDPTTHPSSSTSLFLETLQEEDDDGEDDEEENVYSYADQKQKWKQPSSTSTTTEEEAAEKGLKIAWQYRKDIQEERSGQKLYTNTNSNNNSNVYCHSYDLNGYLLDQESYFKEEDPPHPFYSFLDKKLRTTKNPPEETEKVVDTKDDTTTKERDSINIDELNFSCTCGGHRRGSKNKCSTACGFHLFQVFVSKLQKLLQEQPNKVIRILFYMTTPEDNKSNNTFPNALSLLIFHIRNNQLPVIILLVYESSSSSNTILTTQSSRNSSNATLVSIRRMCDIVVQSEIFTSRNVYPPTMEFQHLYGLLMIPKITTITGCTANGVLTGHYSNITIQKRPITTIYGIKRDNRKLHIQLLHIPPDHGEDDDDDNKNHSTSSSSATGSLRSVVPPKKRNNALSCSSGIIDF